MARSHATTLLENEPADRFGKARVGAYLNWTRAQGDKIREIKNEQQPPTEKEIDDEENRASIEDRFNAEAGEDICD